MKYLCYLIVSYFSGEIFLETVVYTILSGYCAIGRYEEILYSLYKPVKNMALVRKLPY